VRTLAGNEFDVAAKHFVLAAGGIENPRLLLASRGAGERGLGNEHDQVGRYFMEHPHLDTARFLFSDPGENFELYKPHFEGESKVVATLCLSESLCRKESLGRFAVTFETAYTEASEGYEAIRLIGRSLKQREWPDELASKLWDVITDLDGATSAMYRRSRGEAFRLMHRMMVRSEQVPNPDSRVRLAKESDALGMPRAELDWRLTEQDVRTVTRGLKIVGSELGRLGLGRLQMPASGEDDLDIGAHLLGGHHHMGTTRMADDPKQGVVDRDCKVHGLANLYVAGSSVQSTAGFANPTQTLVAFAVRLASHLLGEFRE
jgi:choline dehydrogenase-like flavoprotein